MQITNYLWQSIYSIYEEPKSLKWVFPFALLAGICLTAYRLCPSRVQLLPIPSLAEATSQLQQLGREDKKWTDLSPYDSKKDRYKDILQPKSTMVEVMVEGKKVEYNGAKFTTPHREYIFMQGPFYATFDVTREMMKQNNVGQIVCLTKDIEDKKRKCDPYWGGWNSEANDVCSIKTPTELWTPRQMLHYEQWPDHGVPENIDHFIRFVQFQRKNYQDGAIAVHCSAGIGRTGVFMVATLMMDQLEKGSKNLNPIELIKELRKVRPGMVQTPEQLIFCYKIANLLLGSFS